MCSGGVYLLVEVILFAIFICISFSFFVVVVFRLFNFSFVNSDYVVRLRAAGLALAISASRGFVSGSLATQQGGKP